MIHLLLESAPVGGSTTGIVEYLTIFVLAAFVGIEVVSKVPSILHTPLMSGSNAIHGIVLVGALTIMGEAHGAAEVTLGFLAVFLATLNVVGGFVVTDRMLEMFKGKPGEKAGPRGKAKSQTANAQDAGATPATPATHLSPAGAPPDAGRVLHPDDRARPGLPDRHRRLHLRPQGPELTAPRPAREPGRRAAATLAIAMTFTLPSLRHSGWNLVLALIAMVLGAAIAVPVARYVKMTAMPQLVAIFNGVGGGAAALISIVELLHLHSLGLQPAVYVTAEVLLGVLIGSVSFSGSAIAFIKLQELITGRPITYPGQQVINALVGAAIGVMVILALVTGSIIYVWIILALALVLGVILVLPIGGADVPVLISLLNSFTGLAVAASGFVLDSDLLIVAGTLVGASGIILTRLMSSAMGRSLPNILFSAFGSVITATGGDEGDTTRPVRAGTPDDVGVLLAYARKVVIIPGYGLAVAQAQHTVRELEEALKARGVETFFAIHPVAGRMPGHMNVLLAEANVPYEDLKEMDEANPEMSTADVALVVGANDTVNPAAKSTPGSPIYGMPIIHADEAENIIFLKRSMRPGFAGIDNELLYDPKTTMLFGDAKDTLQKLVAAVNDA